MSSYIRTTRECTFRDLSPEMLAAIQKHVEKYQLGVDETSLLICCETTTTGQKAGFFASGSDLTLTGMFVTPQLLLWTSGNGKRNPPVTSALLRNIDAYDFENTAMYKVKPDSGLNITGRYTDVTRQGQSFIGLGPDSAGEKFRQVLQQAIQKARL